MKSKNAYFTVEAALVLPMIIGAIILAVYLLLFQYNRCLLEQDIGGLVVWSSVSDGGEEELVAGLETRIENIYWEKYLIWEMTGFDVKIKNNICRATGSGQICFPLPGWNFWNEENFWSAETEWECRRIEPVEFVRMCNQLRNRGE